MRQRVQKLVEAGVVQIVAVTDPTQVGLYRQAMIAIRASGDIEAIAEALTQIREVVYIVVVAGSVRHPRRGGGHRRRTPAAPRERPDSRHPRRAPHGDLPLPEVDQTDIRLGCPMTTTPISTAIEIHDFDYERLSATAVEHLWMHFSRMGSYTDGGVPTIVRGEGARIYDAAGKQYLDGLAGLFVVQAGHGRIELAEAAYKQASQLAFFPLWSYAHPAAIALAERLADHTPGDLNKVFFTTGGGEAVETAWKLAKQYFKLVGKPMKHKVISRAVAYHGTPQGALAITGIPAAKQMFEPLTPGGFRVPNTNFYRAPEHGGRRGGIRTVGRRSHRGSDRVRRSGHRRGRLPGAGAELRRLLPAAAWLLPAGPGDLRPARCAARLGRGDLRLRPARLHLRLHQVRLRARHDHLRQGHDERVLPHRRVHRQQPGRRAVLARSDFVPARLHLRRSSGLRGGSHGQPRPVRARAI